MTTSPNSFAPTTQTVDPPNRPDQLADSVLASLDRSRWAYRARPWGLIKTTVLSVITLGLAPLFCWPRRLAAIATVEQQQLWHLAEWLRLRTGKPEATTLRDFATNELSPSPLATLFSIVIPAAAIFAVVQLGGDSLLFEHIRRAVWAYHRAYWWEPRRYIVFLQGWTLFLCAGYMIHWFEVCQRTARLAKYAELFNAATASENIPPVVVRGVGMGFSPAWFVMAALGAWRGAIWAIPLAFTGVVHARYVRVTSRLARAEFARRVRMMLHTDRPALAVRPGPCGNRLCRAPIPAGAAFCPRCGARTA